MGFNGSGNPDEDPEILSEETKGSSMVRRSIMLGFGSVFCELYSHRRNSWTHSNLQSISPSRWVIETNWREGTRENISWPCSCLLHFKVIVSLNIDGALSILIFGEPHHMAPSLTSKFQTNFNTFSGETLSTIRLNRGWRYRMLCVDGHRDSKMVKVHHIFTCCSTNEGDCYSWCFRFITIYSFFFLWTQCWIADQDCERRRIVDQDCERRRFRWIVEQDCERRRRLPLLSNL